MWLDFHSLKARIVLSLLAVLALFAGLTLADNLASAARLRESAVASLGVAAGRAADHLSLTLGRARDVAYVLSTSENLKAMVNERPAVLASPYRTYLLTDTLLKELMYQAEMNTGLASIYLYLESWGRLIATRYGVFTAVEARQTAWLAIARESDSKANRWEAFTDIGFGKGDEQLLGLFTRPDAINRNLRDPVFLSVNIDARTVCAELRALRPTSGSLAYLVDGDGRIAAAEDEARFGMLVTSIVPLPLEELLARGALRLTRVPAAAGRALRGACQVVYRKVGAGPWGVFVLVPEAELLASHRAFQRLALALTGCLALVVGIVAWRIAVAAIDRPVDRLVRFMAEVERGDFDARIGEARRDEFGYLFASIDRMVARISELVRELYQERLARRESELKVLQSQINPHFLYNTLDTINWIARSHGAEDISRIVRGLSSLYRAAFNRGRECIEVGEMVRSMEGYLLVERYRYRNLADYRIEVDPSAEGWLVPNLVLQPVVENAVVHGIGALDRPGRITVTARREGLALRICVEDDGVGMEPAKLSLLRASIDAEGEDGDSGLRNVQRRIRISYGAPWGLAIASEPGAGTRVEITLPVACPLRRAPETPARGSGDTPKGRRPPPAGTPGRSD